MGLDSEFFNYFQHWITTCLQTFQDTVIINAYGYRVTLWDLYTVSTTLIAFFDAVIFPILSLFGLVNDPESDGILDDVEKSEDE